MSTAQRIGRERVAKARAAVVENAYALAGEIAHCPVMVKCLQGAEHPCRRVVLAPWPTAVDGAARLRRWPGEHHLPEPWVGHIESAPLLFLSSNPSVSPRRVEKSPATATEYELPSDLAERSAVEHPSLRKPFQAPKWSWGYDEIFDRYTALFDMWVDNADHRLRVPVGFPADKRSRYWRSVNQHAVSLLGADVRPGRDYALTEIVHCKSQREAGVNKAKAECVPRYLRRVLRLSPATLIVVFGDHARNAVRSEFSYPDPGALSRPLQIEGRERRVAFLAYPGATNPKRSKALTPSELVEARRWLAETREVDSRT